MKKRFHKSGQPQRDRAPRGASDGRPFAQNRKERQGSDDKKPYGDKPYGDKKAQGGHKPHGDKKPFRDKKPFGDNHPFGTKKPDRRPRPPRAPERPQAAPGPARLTGSLLWGLHAVRAALSNRKRTILRLIATESGAQAIDEVLNRAREEGLRRPAVEAVSKDAFDRLLPPGAVHQGVAAAVEPLPVRDAHDLVAGLHEGEAATIVILDQVTDPHNVGAILRSAAAFGARGVILQDRHAPELSGVLAKTACGAVDILPVAVETNLSRAIALLQEHGFTVVGLDERGTPMAALTPRLRTALVLGAEGAGLRRLVADHCDALAALPTRGPILSLNVSNAAAVALYALSLHSGNSTATACI